MQKKRNKIKYNHNERRRGREVSLLSNIYLFVSYIRMVLLLGLDYNRAARREVKMAKNPVPVRRFRAMYSLLVSWLS